HHHFYLPLVHSFFIFLLFSPLYLLFFFFLMLPPPPRSTLFPYTTLFRSTKSGRTPSGRLIKASRGPSCANWITVCPAATTWPGSLKVRTITPSASANKTAYSLELLLTLACASAASNCPLALSRAPRA